MFSTLFSTHFLGILEKELDANIFWGYGVNVKGPSHCYMGEISEKSKQYLPRKFDNMLQKFHFGPKFIKKPELLNNTVHTSPCNVRDVY